MVLLLGIGAPVASAAPEASPGWAFKGNFGEVSIYREGRTPIAVDGSGNIFGTVVFQRVRIYSPSSDGGTLLTDFETPFLLGRSIAVDPSDGTIYADGAVGQPVVRLISDGAPTPTYTIDPTFEVTQGEGLAVDPTTGDLLIADPGVEGVRRYDSSGTLLETIATPSISPASIVTAPDGSFYVASSDGPDIVHFSGTGTLLGTISGVGSLRGLAYDASHSWIVAAVGEKLKSYTTAGTLVSESPVQGGGGIGLVAGSSGSLYEHTGGSINYYAPGTVPGVEAPQVSAIEATSAHFSAEVDPGAGPPAGSVAHFEVSADGGQTWPEELKTEDVPVERIGTEAPDTIEADLTGLKANSEYRVRVVASNGDPITSTSAATPFHTLLGPPEVETGPATSITDTKAELTGTIDTIGGQTTYHFEYGTTAAYGSRIPVEGEAPAGMSRTPRTVSRPIAGLQPGTTYHYRLVATNAAGTTNGPDRTFDTAAAASPVRGYEQVTPVDKKGGVGNSRLGFQAAADGSAVSYSLPAAPKDAPSAVIFTRYMSLRGSDDWLDWSPTDPPLDVAPNPSAPIESVTQAISADFTHALVVSNRALTPGAEDGGGNIYLENLRTSEFTLIGSAPGWDSYASMTTLQTENMFLAGAPDFSWITIVAPRSLLPGAPRTAMYRWSPSEGLTLQSSTTASVTRFDGGNELSMRWVSDDGSVMYYDLEDGDGAVYRHDLGGATTPVSVAEAGGSVPEGTVVGAKLDGISRDGRYAIIRTAQRLTADDPPTFNGTWMYRVDMQSGDIELIGQPANTANGGVYTVGDDAKTAFYHYDTGGSVSWRDGVTHKFTDSHLDFSGGLGVQRFASPNGRYLAYIDSVDGGAVHLYDAETQTDVCVNCVDGGRDGGLPGGARYVSNRTPEVVNNSGQMFFDTAARLVAADHNGSRDVYSYQDGKLSLISPGEGNFTARFADATPDGSVVYFTTDQGLVGQDTDGQIDVYASRLGPVFDQSATPSGECAGEGCRDPSVLPPGPAKLASEALAAAGDPTIATISGIRKLSSSDISTLAKGGKARLKLTVSAAGKVSVTGKAKVGKKTRQVVSASTKAAKAGSVSVPFGLSKAGMSALNSQGSLTVHLTVRFKDATPKAVKFTLRSATAKNGGRS